MLPLFLCVHNVSFQVSGMVFVWKHSFIRSNLLYNKCQDPSRKPLRCGSDAG